ncbi:MAG: type IV pilin [Candidatus Bathyarchaeia archaeon]
METIKRKLNNKAVSSVVAEILMVAIAVVLATAFIVGLQGNVTSQIQDKDQSSVHVWASTRNGWVNITAIHSGGDATDISGHVFLTYQNAAITDISEHTYFLYPNDTLQYPNGILMYLKDGFLQYSNGILNYPSGTLHYPNGTLQYPNGTTQDTDIKLSANSLIVNGDFSLSQLTFGQQFSVNIDIRDLSSAQVTQGLIHYIISSKDQILAEVDQKLETTYE